MRTALPVLGFLILTACDGASNLTLQGLESNLQDFQISRQSGRVDAAYSFTTSITFDAESKWISMNQLQNSRSCFVRVELTDSEVDEIKSAFLQITTCGTPSSQDPPAYDQTISIIRWNQDEWDNGCQDDCDAIDEQQRNLNTIDMNNGSDSSSTIFRVCEENPRVYDLLEAKLTASLLTESSCPLSFEFMIDPDLEIGSNN